MRSGRVAVIDDEKAIRDFMVGALQGLGHTVVFADDGAKAPELLKGASMDLVILDLALQGGSGAGVYAWLRSRPETKALPVVICTVQRAQSITRALGASPEGDDPRLFHLYKPFTIRALYAVVAQALGEDPRTLPPLGA